MIGWGDLLFNDWRYESDGTPKPEFILNQDSSKGLKILLAGDNFGCGSSREHAPWALTQYGFRAIISTSFADIFKSNSLKNSLLPIVVGPEIHKKLFSMADSSVKVDLASQTITLADGSKVRALVQLGSKRHPMLPDTPTMDELGMKGFSSASWMGIFVPSSTPDAIVTRFHDDLAHVLGDSWVRERMASMGVELTVGSSADLGQFVKTELARWGDVVKRYNIKAE